jgi:hypothetical protein
MLPAGAGSFVRSTGRGDRMGEATEQAIHFAGGTWERIRHVCGFFVPPEEFLRELRDRVRD